MEKHENITILKVPVIIALSAEDLAYIEKYRHLASEKGLNQSLEDFIECLLGIGCVPHLKRQAAFFIGGEIID